MSRPTVPSPGRTRGVKKRPNVNPVQVGDGARCVAIDNEGVPRWQRPLSKGPKKALRGGGR